MLKKIKGAIFDFDGTIYNSMNFWSKVSSNFLKENYNIIDNEIDKQCEILTTIEAVNLMNEKHNLKIMEKDIFNFLKESYVILNAKEKVLKIINDYYENGIKMIIATVTTKTLVEKALLNLGIKDCFIDVVSVEEIGKSKNYPDVYNECLKRLDLNKSDVVVYEDSIYAIKTLLNNSFNVIGVKELDDLSIFKNLEVI